MFAFLTINRSTANGEGVHWEKGEGGARIRRYRR